MSVSADRERIEHVLTSLVGIAIASTRVGAEIVVSAVPSTDGVRFAVTPSGPAALPEHVDNLFGPAAVASSNDLGSHLCKRVIEAHGGRMGVETAAAGRTYWFELPTEPSVLR